MESPRPLNMKALAKAIDRVDPDHSKAHAIARKMQDETDPDHPKNNRNPLRVKDGEVLILEEVLSGRRDAVQVLGAPTAGWDQRLHIHLGSPSSTLRVVTSSLTIESNGVNGIHHILPPNRIMGFRGINHSVRIVNVFLG